MRRLCISALLLLAAIAHAQTDAGAYQYVGGGGGTPVASVSPSSIPFGSQTVSTTSGPQTVTVTNTGTASLLFTGYALTTGTQFALGANTCATTYGGSLPQGDTCTISLTFTPTSTGSKSDTLTLTNNSGGTPGTTQTVGLSGTGVSGSTWTLNQHPNNFTVEWGSAGTTQTCSITATVTAGHTLIFGLSEWTHGGSPTFGSITGDMFVHPSGARLSQANASDATKVFTTDAAYILSAAGETSHTYTWTEDTTAGSGNISCELADITASSSPVALDGTTSIGYSGCSSGSPCVSPSLALNGSSDYVYQIVAMGYGGPAAPGAPYTSPSDPDNSNVYGGFFGALNQSSVAPITYDNTNATDYPAATVIAFQISSGTHYSLTTSSSGNGTLGGTNCSTGSYAAGTSISCVATPNLGYAFTGWSGGTCSGTSFTCSFSLSGASTVAASYTSTPPLTAPSYSTIVSSIQALSGWLNEHDSGTDPGTSSGEFSVVSSPSLSGQAAQTVTTFDNYGGQRYYVDYAADEVPTNFLYDGWLYIPSASSSSIANVEIDNNQVIANGNTVIYGFQCDGNNGVWDYTGNAGTPVDYIDTWYHTTIPCNPPSWTPNVWHHVQVYYYRDASGNVTYQSVYFDGTLSPINETVPSAFTLGWASSLITNLQIDGGLSGAAGTATVLLDNLTISRWTPAVLVPAPPTLLLTPF